MRNMLFVGLGILTASAAVPASAQYYNDGYGSDRVRCESNDGRYNECPAGPGRYVLDRQLSRSACIEGRSWGQGRGGLWVDDGCRADFRRQGYGGGYGRDDDDDRGNYYGGNYGGYYGGYGDGYGRTVRCESSDGRTNRCALPSRGRAQLVRQISRSACIEGQTYGTEYGSVWVSQGCRGDFVASGRRNGGWNGGWNGGGWGDSGMGGRVFRCESNDNRYSECAANIRAGVQLIRQLSNSPCVEGRTWGYGGRGIWVAQGCRAEFRSY